MAIFTTGGPVGSISGKLGGIVYVQAKKQAVVRMRPAKRNAVSPRRQATLSRFVALQQHWADLTEAERLTWRTAAAATTLTNRLGRSSPPGAFQLFIRENALLQNSPAAAIETPPIGSRSSPPRAVAAVFSASGTYNVQAQPGGTALSAIFYVYGWQLCKTYHTDAPPRFVTMLKSGAASLNANIQVAWANVFGELLEDQVFTIAVRNQTAGQFISDEVIVRGVTAA